MFYPDPLPVPAFLQTAAFRLEPLTPAHLRLDYDAVMESREQLRLWSGSAWPADDFTLEANLRDLQRHDCEHRERIAFTYTVLDSAGERCLGCLYIRPLLELLPYNRRLLAAARADQALARFWVRPRAHEEGLDRRLLAALIAWFPSAWSFSSVFFHTPAAHSLQLVLFQGAGLQHILTLQIPSRGGAHHFFA